MANYQKLMDKLELAKDLGPENREYNYKGRIKQAFRAVNGNMGTSIVINVLLLIFASPIIALFIFYLPIYIQNIISAEGLSFTSGIGIDYGVINDTVRGIEIVYDKSLNFILYFFTPSMIILGVGMSGAFYCCRNLLWGAKVKVFKHFFRGIGKNWYKFILAFGYLGLVGTSLGSGLCILLKNMAIFGKCNAGIWVWVIASCILALLSVIYFLFALPTHVQYNFSFKATIKNSVLLAPLLIIPSIMVMIGLALPMLLSLVGIIKFIVYIYVIALGLTQYTTFILAFGQYANDNFVRALFDVQIKTRQREQEKEKKKNNQQKNKEQKAQNKITYNKKKK